MKINTSYPYPVINKNNDDYKDSSFKAAFDIKHSFGEIVIHVDFYLENDEIQRLIEKETCVFMLHVECGQTSYRNAFRTIRNTLDISIPAEKLRGKIEIHSFIIANEKIEDYSNNRLNDWFQGIPISFEKGNILAIGEGIETTLYDDTLELLNLPSIAKVTKSLKNDYMEVEYNSDIISISLPEYEYKQYATKAKSNLKNTILSNIILPSLVYIFTKVSENSEELEEYTWYQVLEKIFEENNYRLEDVGTDSLSALKAAQMVLRKPIKTSFEEIEKFHKMED